ncbi:hypothetical protein INR77_10730 [Erythrobacter sp. SCSIO 43205]|uniref:hypothetical protein n=1 Tax=Erythrobacter sp. SCSIO 43205 TaxID=2779361 RepID=UPI001CA8B992|nr:hypothetical protein [Erythrobacter sp. SCSIO 43205]UAB77286.1 hypothetical protein INR77_10730 [Erythrobacter sp. SCSIO 43205]
MRGDLALVLFVLLATSACFEAEGDKYQNRDARLQEALKGNTEGLGSSPAWLVKVSSMAPDDRTAVFYGYGDNFQACSEFAEEMNESGREVEYACAAMIE